MGQSQLHWRVVFRLETIRRDMACSLLHKSAVSVNTSQERCDNFSITLGRRVFVSPCLTGRAQGSAVFISSTATVCRHGGAKGQSGGMYDSDIYQGV